MRLQAFHFDGCGRYFYVLGVYSHYFTCYSGLKKEDERADLIAYLKAYAELLLLIFFHSSFYAP
jgi:hypothetical protein